MADEQSRAEPEPKATGPAAMSQPAAGRDGGRGLTTGWLIVAGVAIVDLAVIAVGGSHACGPTPNPVGGWGFLVLLLVPVGLAADGITSLVLASDARRSAGSRRGFRALGAIALALALVSVPVGFLAAMSWAMCF